jgi:hypothetical protein
MLAMRFSIRTAAVVLLAGLSFNVALAWGQNLAPRDPNAGRRTDAEGPAPPQDYDEREPEYVPRREPADDRAPEPREAIDPRGPAVPRQASAPRPLQPPWYPQPAEHQKYVDEVLTFWEQESAKIERYKC